MANKGKCVNESRSGNSYMKIFDQSDGENFKLAIESNTLKQSKFSTKVQCGNLLITGEYEEKIGSTLYKRQMCFEYSLPNDIDPDEIEIKDAGDQLLIVAPRKK